MKVDLHAVAERLMEQGLGEDFEIQICKDIVDVTDYENPPPHRYRSFENTGIPYIKLVPKKWKPREK